MSIYSLGLRLLDMFEVIHSAGYVLNELSMSKILLGPNQPIEIDKKDLIKNCFDGKSLHFVDLSYATPYVNHSTGKLEKQQKVQCAINLKNEF